MIFRASFKSVVPKFFGAHDLQVGDPQFDHSFVIQANPRCVAERIFRADRRIDVILSVLRLDPMPDATVHLTRECLTVKARGYLTQEAHLLSQARTALDFTQYVL